nr:hypothetical protein [Tanacetum cinerariifolium]
MQTAMVPEQVQTMKIQAGIQVSRPRELRRQVHLWKRFRRCHLIVFVLVRNIVCKDGKPLMVARRGHFDANRPGVNEDGDLITVVNNIAATSQNYALNKNDGVIHVSGHNECTYRVVSTDDQVTPANDVSTSAMKNINMTQNVLKNEKSVTFVASLSDAANTNKEDTWGC